MNRKHRQRHKEIPRKLDRALEGRVFVVIWQFQVAPEKRRAFERAYGRKGAWAKLFQTGRGYIRTDLIRDLHSPNRYFTLDYWRSRRDYEIFRAQNREAYLAIDRKCEVLTVKETEIGWFTSKS